MLLILVILCCRKCVTQFIIIFTVLYTCRVAGMFVISYTKLFAQAVKLSQYRVSCLGVLLRIHGCVPTLIITYSLPPWPNKNKRLLHSQSYNHHVVSSSYTTISAFNHSQTPFQSSHQSITPRVPIRNGMQLIHPTFYSYNITPSISR